MTTTNDDIVKGILAGGAEALADIRGEEVPGAEAALRAVRAEQQAQSA